MALQTSGPISMSEIIEEVFGSSSGTSSLLTCASVAGLGSAPQSMSDFYGYDNGAGTAITVSTRGFTKNHACGLSATFTTYYHDGSGTYPASGDYVYTDSAMTTTPTNGWYHHDGNRSVNLVSGLVLNDEAC
jgi:hypothetical protein